MPEFILANAPIGEQDELLAVVQLPDGPQPCTSCGVIDRHLMPIATGTPSANSLWPGGRAGCGCENDDLSCTEQVV